MGMYAIFLTSLAGLCVLVVVWLAWTGRRDLRCYRRRCGGQWGCVRDKTHWGMAPILRWAPAAEIQEGEHVVEWETWPGRTRVRGKRGER